VNPLKSDRVSWRAQFQIASYAECLFRQRFLWLMTILKQDQAEGAAFLDVPVISNRRTISGRDARRL